jgi:hypothetical protein
VMMKRIGRSAAIALPVLALPVLALLCSVLGGAEPVAAATVAAAPVVPGTSCPSFPADAAWNTPITGLPVSPMSGTWLSAMSAATTKLHPDFGPSGDPINPYGIPYTVVTNSTATTSVSFQYADESDPGPYPFTASTPIEGGASATGDRHAIMVNSSTCELYELYDAYYAPGGGSTAGSGATWSLGADSLRPSGWTSADAAGLPILPLLTTYDQAAAGVIDHAIRVTASCTSQAYIWPARHQAGSANSTCPPMGARFRLNPSFALPSSSCSTTCQAVITAMKTYGLIVADNGSNWYFQGTADSRWTYSDVDQLKQIPASAFAAVDASCLEESSGSLQAYQPGTAGYASHCGGGLPQSSGSNDCSFTSPAAGIAAVSIGGAPGYLRVDSSGQVCASGSAQWKGDPARTRLAAPVVGIGSTPDGLGYWLVASDGGVFSYGDAAFHGSTGGIRLARPVVGMAPTSDGGGYWLVASDGGVFTFGDAAFHGSTGGIRLAQPVVGMAAAPAGRGYWLVASDGGVFTFTSSGFYGSLGGIHLNRPIVGMASSPDAKGYTLVASDGGVFDFGDAHFYGSLGADPPPSPVVGLAPVSTGNGYFLLDSGGTVYPFGPGA